MTEKEQTKTVLIIEDDDQISYLLKFLVEREGYSVISAADGQIAHDLIEDIEPPDLVLLDMMLPYIDGYELYKKMRLNISWNDVSVIVLSTKSQEKDIVKMLDKGVNDYVVKPFQPMELLSRIKRIL